MLALIVRRLFSVFTWYVTIGLSIGTSTFQSVFVVMTIESYCYYRAEELGFFYTFLFIVVSFSFNIVFQLCTLRI